MPAVLRRTCGLLAIMSFAVEADDNKLALTEMVVTGTRTVKPLLESPVRVEVVTRQEIERTHARDLKEALEDVPGLLLKRIHGKGGYAVWLQGLDSDRVLVVVNGEPITPSTGSTIDLSQIGVADVERIEVVKGATSALYGSAAMGGVINVITRKPQAPLAYRLTVDGGSWGEKNVGGSSTDVARRHLSGKFAVKRPTWYLDLSGNVRDSDGFDLDPDTYSFEGDEGLKANFDARLAWTPSADTEVYLAPRYYREDVSNALFTFAPGVGEVKRVRREDAARHHYTAGIEHHFRHNSSLRSWLVYDNWNSETQQDAIVTPQVELERQAEIDLYRAELQWDQSWGNHHLFTSGLVLGQATLVQNKFENNQRVDEVDNKSNHNLEAYIQDDIFLGEIWELVPGLRVQDDSDFGFYAAPKINAMVTPDWFENVVANIRFGYGRGYRVPNLKERYFVFDHSAVGYMVLGNADLQPESSDSFQLSFELALPDVFHADISLFHNRITDLIETDLNRQQSAAQGLQIFEYENIARALTQGVELSGRYYIGGFQFKSSYTWLDSEDRDTGKTLVERPEHQIKLGFDYEQKNWGTTFTVRSVYQSEEYIDSDNQVESPAWHTWDMKLTQALGKNLKVFGGIDNLTDEHRDPSKHGLDFRPLEPRFVYLGLQVEES